MGNQSVSLGQFGHSEATHSAAEDSWQDYGGTRLDGSDAALAFRPGLEVEPTELFTHLREWTWLSVPCCSPGNPVFGC